MSDETKTLSVFVDTEVFETAGFNFGSRDLERLQLAVNDESIRLYLTTVTQREILQHIDAKAAEAFKKLREFRSQIGGLHPLTGALTGLGAVTRDSLRTEFHQRFADFCKRTRAQIISIDDVPVEAVMERYFSNLPPFVRAGKKHEFPDAFAALALESWCDKRKLNMIVVSADQDWRDVCESSKVLEHKSKLVEVFSMLPDPSIAARLVHALKLRSVEVSKAICNEFENLPLIFDEVDGIAQNLKALEVDLVEFYVLDANEGNCVIEIQIEVRYSVYVSYYDSDSWIYDSEDKRAIYMRRIEGVIRSSEELDAEVQLTYDVQKPDSIKIEKIKLSESDLIISILEMPSDLDFDDRP